MKRIRLIHGILLIIVLYVILRLMYINFVPLWDGWEYYGHGCILQAAQERFSIWNLDCHNHMSWAYILLYVVFQWLQPGNIYLLHLPSILLGILSIWFFYKLMTLILDKTIYP